MEKSWIEMPRNTPVHIEGLNTFLDFSFANSSVRGEIVCLCPKCNFNKWQCREIVYEHLILKIQCGFYIGREEEQMCQMKYM